MTRRVRHETIGVVVATSSELLFAGCSAVYGLNPGLAAACLYFAFATLHYVDELTRELWGDDR